MKPARGGSLVDAKLALNATILTPLMLEPLLNKNYKSYIERWLSGQIQKLRLGFCNKPFIIIL
jgi:hypothetical protein